MSIPTTPVRRLGPTPGPAAERLRLQSMAPRRRVRAAPAPVQVRTAPAATFSVRDWPAASE